MLRAAVVGATGVVGQRFVESLNGHPWFALEQLAGSERSAGKGYGQALRDPDTGAMRWYAQRPPPAGALELPVVRTDELRLDDLDLVFTGVESEVARQLEPKLAAEIPVVTTASAFRYEADVPLLVPGVNSDHVTLIERQRTQRGWRGFIAPIPNCTTTGLTMTLKPIADAFGVERVVMTSLQAVSGAGREGGVLALDIVDNVIPYIPREEEKVQRETAKILGRLEDGNIRPAAFPVSTTCMRVNVQDGHTEAVFVATRDACTPDAVKDAMRRFAPTLHGTGLPSAPPELIVVHDDPFRPQPRLDREMYDGMATVVGRIRIDPTWSHGVKYVLVSHNTKIGAARGAVLVAELLYERGYLGART